MITINFSNVINAPGNCFYPHQIEITDKESFIQAVSHDYVCAEYRDNKRGGQNFIGSNCLAMDCDNDFSENPEDWITVDKIQQAFQNVSVFIHYSRNNMKEKNGKKARPKFHVLFPIDYTTSAEVYKRLKRQVYDFFPYFDNNAMDVARFFFGTDRPIVEIYPGELNLSQFLSEKNLKTVSETTEVKNRKKNWSYDPTPITEGNRNSQMYKFACKILRKRGDTDLARQYFLEQAEACTPPLSDAELATIWKSAQKYYAGKVQLNTVNPSLIYKPEDYSDVGQAKVFAEHYRDKLRYSDSTKFIHYNGMYWEESDIKAQAFAQELTDLQLMESLTYKEVAQKKMKKTGLIELIEKVGQIKAQTILTDEQKTSKESSLLAEEYNKFVLRRRNSDKIQAMLKEVRPMIEIDHNELDIDPYLLCTPGGTYDLRQGLAGKREHSPDDFITKITKVSPGEKGKEIWLDCLNKIFCNDQMLIDYVQTICGLIAIGRVTVEALIIAYGIGRNGKSTFWNAISRVLYMYSGSISADTLTVNRFKNTKPELAEIRGKRFLIAAELYEGARLDDSMVKQLCSTDEIHAEKKFKAPFKFIPSHNLVLYTNHLPKVSATDDGTWRRLIVIPFNAKFEGNNDIKNYTEYLLENAGESILSWIIEGAQKIIEQNFRLNVPKVVQEAIDEYRNQSNWFKNFLNDCCELNADFCESSQKLYNAYRAYSFNENEKPKSTTEFYNMLKTEGFIRIEINRRQYIKGLKLKSTDTESEDFLVA